MHISEIVSDILDPVVSTYNGGREIISTEDLLARLEIVNDKNSGWSPTSYWGGMITDEFRACGTCEGTDDYEWDGNIPEVCKCDDGIDGDGRIMVTATCMKMVRRDLWEKTNDWGEGELDRILLGTEVLHEDLQDVSKPMVIIGTDVVNLYPSLDIKKVVGNVNEAILESKSRGRKLISLKGQDM